MAQRPRRWRSDRPVTAANVDPPCGRPASAGRVAPGQSAIRPASQRGERNLHGGGLASLLACDHGERHLRLRALAQQEAHT
jgi:hypothetical protein